MSKLSSRDKGLIVFVVLAVLFAGGFIYHTWSQQQGHAAAKITVPMEAMPKGAWLKAQRSGQNTSDSNASGSGQ